MNKPIVIIPVLVAAAALVTGCGSSGSDPDTVADDNLSVNLSLPDSMTGGKVTSSRDLAAKIQSGISANRGGTGEPCTYVGVDDEDDPFENGYKTTRFLVSTMATWTCIADFLIDVADVVVHDGSIVETDNDYQAANYDPEEPTHYSVTDESNTQTTIRMYYGFDRASPPTQNDVSQFYISWHSTTEEQVEGRMVIDACALNDVTCDLEEPAWMRMDFDFATASKTADMFIRFDDLHPWADGMRIHIVKDLQAPMFGQVYTARGLINMTSQFLPADGITEVPDVRLYAVADGLGNGAAIEEIQNMSLPLRLNDFNDNHLGNYLFTKRDVYFFEDDMDWEYIDKTITASSYRGGRTTPESGGTWVPFDPSLDMVRTALLLDPAYFTGSLCANSNDDCNDFLNAIFMDGFADQEQNQGNDPLDWRSDALNAAVYLDSVYPNGTNWQGAFDQSFTPTL